jgi:hypothetical protein
MSVTGTTSLAGAAPSGGATEVLDPNVELESVESPSTEVQEDEAPPTTETAESGQPEGGRTKPEGEVREDGRLIPKWMKELQQTNPEAYKKAKTDLFELQGRRSIHPTAQAAREEHDLVQSLGGKEGVAKLRENDRFYSEAANQFLKGDPAFVKDLWEEDKIAAALHVQPMLDAFKQNDFEGYRTTIGRMQKQELDAVGFGPALRNLIDAVEKKDFESALNILVKGRDAQGNPSNFVSWYNSIHDIASKAEDPRVKSLLAERAKARDTEAQTEQQNFLKSYRTEALNTVLDDAGKVFDQYFKGRKLDPEDRLDLLKDAVKLVNSKMEADKAFMEDRDGHLKLRDSHSALQLTKARFARELPEAVKRIARRYGMTSGTPGNGNQQRQQQQPAGGGRQPDAGYVAVTARPSPEDIDRSRTTNEMIFAKKAILKDGRKVDWSKLR